MRNKNESEAVKKVWEEIAKIAPYFASVLLIGETGTGKGYFAEEIHAQSPRKLEPFRSANCGSLEGHTLHSELFGHEEGAFTGATSQRLGVFERANRGTVFLDEIGTMPEEGQINLLTFLDKKEFTRLGGESVEHADVRLIAATNANITELARQGKFRKDLYYKILGDGGSLIEVPPLRERLEEIEEFIPRFINAFNEENSKRIKGLNTDDKEEILGYLKQQKWSGNIRQLRSAVFAACITCDRRHSERGSSATDRVLEKGDFPDETTLSKIEVFEDIPNNMDGIEKNVSTGKQEPFIAETQTAKKVAAAIETVAPYPYSVLITGEMGAGKARVAKLIHAASRRKDKNFITGNCDALSPDIFHSKLFGNEREASPPIRGLFERATGGTLFLDDIDAIPAEGQATLRHLLETQTFTRVGGTEEIETDVRLIAATTTDLAELVHQGKFRKDLYYKLIECRIEVPPLRDRRDEIKDLVAGFIREFNAQNHKRIEETMDEKVLAYLKQQEFPGNLRQLEMATRRACIHCPDTVLKIEHFPAEAELSDIHAPQATSPTPAENQEHTAFESIFKKLKEVLKEDETCKKYMDERSEDFFTIYVFKSLKERSDLAPSLAKFSAMSLQEMLDIKKVNRNTYNPWQGKWNKEEGLLELLCRILKESEVL